MSASRPAVPAPATPKGIIPGTPTRPTTPSAPLVQTPKESPPTPMSKMPATPTHTASISLSAPGVETGILLASYEQALLWAHQHSTTMYTAVPQVVSGPPPKEPVRPKGLKLTAEEISLVQGLVERCLGLYMSQNEVISALHQQANIEPGFTSLVWQKLEEQNPQFFKCYALRMKMKEQITAFNYLVGQQAQLLQRPSAAAAAAAANSPGGILLRAGSAAPTVASQQKKSIGIGTVSFAPLSNPLKSYTPPASSAAAVATSSTPAPAATTTAITASSASVSASAPPSATAAPAAPSAAKPPNAVPPPTNPLTLANHDFLSVLDHHDKDSKERHAHDTFDVSQFFDDEGGS